MKYIPTDREMFETIYERYHDAFVAYNDDESVRSNKTFVPLDLEALATDLGMDTDVLFGRLYYHLNHRFAYKEDGGAEVNLFAIRIGGDAHCIHFPYMVSILADLRDHNRKYRTATTIAAISIVLSILSVLISILD